ncbi:hypothetical protein NG701_15915 [Pseudarthrobacter sp. HLT3-5]|nr:hypothetical protein [Pseudarthrobacter sp. HLT3-5]MCO4254245.1 hypothetical protein [Pseudarthrobacter sp. HLT1-5]MCO4275897.1 hypothetical protein [Pseudarthrobacter sp. HLT3-5]
MAQSFRPMLPEATPTTRLKPSSVLKDEFFAVLARVGSVSVAARELGLA